MSTILKHVMSPYWEFRMQAWNMLHAARWKYRTQKFALYALSHNFIGLSLQLRHVSAIGKKLVKQQYLLHMSSEHGELRLTNGWQFAAPHQISMGFLSWLRYCTDVAQWRSTKLCSMFGRLLGWCTIYTFSGAFAYNKILPGAKFTLRPNLAFSYISSITARHSSSACQPNFVACFGRTATTWYFCATSSSFCWHKFPGKL